MLLYSKTIQAFLERLKKETRIILRQEMCLELQKSRILYRGILYPLNLIVFEDHKRLGYFDSRTYELGISKKLMYLAHDEVLKNVIRHELAHFMCFLLYGNRVVHGEEFHQLCRQYGWGQEVYAAYANLDIENATIVQSDDKTQKLLNRLKKLLALASSDNAHESETATLKANELLLEHNIDHTKTQGPQEEVVCVLRVLEASRKSSKHIAIYEILKTFFVSPVFNHGRGIFYLEVIGDKVSVELADYVAHFLDKELDVLWKQTQLENPNIKGMASKNSFYKGVAKGYVEKIEFQKKRLALGSDLVVIEKNIQRYLSIVYPRIGHSSLAEGQHNEEAHNAGKKKGANLSIKPALNSERAEKIKYLT